MKKTKKALVFSGDHGCPCDYPELIEVDEKTEMINHYTEADEAVEEGLKAPLVLEFANTKEKYEKCIDEADEVVLCDNSGSDYPEEVTPMEWDELVSIVEE